MGGPKGYGFSAVGYGFCTQVLNWVCFFLEEASFSSLSIRPTTKVIHKGQLRQPHRS